MEANIANAETEAANNRNTAMHKCTDCGEWFESSKLYDDKCTNCK